MTCVLCARYVHALPIDDRYTYRYVLIRNRALCYECLRGANSQASSLEAGKREKADT
jgi:hypothetical protein